MRDLDWSDVVADGERAAEASGYGPDYDTRSSEGRQDAIETLAEHTVPGTNIVIAIEVRYADPELARLLEQPAGTDSWINQYTVVRRPGSSSFVNYLLFGRQSEQEARELANQLWIDSIQRRDRYNLNSVCRTFLRP